MNTHTQLCRAAIQRKGLVAIDPIVPDSPRGYFPDNTRPLR